MLANDVWRCYLFGGEETHDRSVFVHPTVMSKVKRLKLQQMPPTNISVLAGYVSVISKNILRIFARRLTLLITYHSLLPSFERPCLIYIDVYGETETDRQR